MQKATIAALIAVIAAVMTGCTSTESVITEFDAAGKITRRTETSESVIKTISKGTVDKSVIIWEDGWVGYISVSAGTIEDPTPHGKIFAGKTNKGWISILPNHQNLPGIAKVIQATKSDIEVSLEGITANSSEIQTAKNLKTEQTE